ncbi:caspase family protein [Pseudanabaena galeata UHCC 0370]|uniref:Caspase family protein n=1 Tax=Pseudanabaena galeata UHCC 0370 TaxID=3110310 RepID=A0ABU5TEY5_9CYAN|nr:caspase family protein [Pseudanabaena galeata]MEA5476814.1 caspase family protein [Pseudanabaena galeata UHCC 0370]
MGKNLALLVGISNYLNIPKLLPCEEDLFLMSEVIQKTNKYDEILILDKSPSSMRGKQEISSFVRKYQREEIDEVFFYYTGHGSRDKDDFIFLFSDFTESKSKITSLSNIELDSMLKSLNPKLAVKVVDACHSGTEYVKSPQELESILRKSSDESFSKIYFLFSSSKSEYSIALKDDYSVFTKGFAKSLVDFAGRDIRYRDIMSSLADDLTITQHQTPLFVIQADNTEVFCNVSDDLLNLVSTKLEGNKEETEEGKDSGQTDTEETQTYEEKLIAEIRIKAKEFCNEQEALTSLQKLKKYIKNFSWDSLMTQLYEITTDEQPDYSSITGMSSIAKWLLENDESYFAEVTYESESYEEKEKIEMENDYRSAFAISGRPVQYKFVTKYRDVINSIKLTASVKDCAFIISFSPKEEILPAFKSYVIYIFSKSKLTIFYKHEIEKEISWKNRIVQNNNQWKVVSCRLKQIDEVTKTIDVILEQIKKSIIKDFSSILNIEQEI